MAKDPAFLFYHQDFFTGVSDMTNEETGAYIKCMCVQASKNGISEKHMSIICQSQEVHNLIKSKFILNPETNLFENLRLKSEIEKRIKYSESRSNNRKKGNKEVNISKSYVKHMENENEIEEVLVIEKGNNVFSIQNFTPKLSDENFKTPPRNILENARRIIDQRSGQMGTTETDVGYWWGEFKTANFTGTRNYFKISDVGDHFINWLRKQDCKRPKQPTQNDYTKLIQETAKRSAELAAKRL